MAEGARRCSPLRTEYLLKIRLRDTPGRRRLASVPLFEGIVEQTRSCASCLLLYGWLQRPLQPTHEKLFSREIFYRSFFKISLSCRSISFSRFNKLISSSSVV